MIPHQYVHRKDNPQIILMAGYTDFKNNYNIDTSVYAIKIGELPEGATFEVRKSQATLVAEARGAMGRYYNSLPSGIRLAFSDTITKVNSLLDLGDHELALQITQDVDVTLAPEELQNEAAAAKATFIAGLTQLTGS